MRGSTGDMGDITPFGKKMECIRSTKFTCRAFAFRYGQQRHAGVIDNCQLSDWPVRDMDKERHLILDAAFDIFERASYGHGCEIQPIVDEKHKKRGLFRTVFLCQNQC